MEFLVILLFVGVVFGFLGSFIAGQKGRDGGEGFVLGLVFGPLGCLIEALLPSVAPPPGDGPGTISRPTTRADQQANADRLDAAMQRQRDANRAEEEDRRRRAAIAAERRREWWASTKRASSTRWRVLKRWFWRHDLVQAVVFGLAIAVPAAIVAVIIARRR